MKGRDSVDGSKGFVAMVEENRASEIRILEPRDLPELLALTQQNQLEKSARPLFEPGCPSFSAYLNPDNKKKCLVGRFENGTLSDVLAASVWESFSWMIMDGFLSRGHNAGDSTLRRAECFNFLWRYSWSLGIYKAYFFIAASRSFSIQKRKLDNVNLEGTEPQKRSQLLVEDFVPAHSCPLHPASWKTMGCRSYSFDGLIISLSLQTQDRNEQLRTCQSQLMSLI